MRKRRLKHRCAVWLLVEKGKRLSAHQQRRSQPQHEVSNRRTSRSYRRSFGVYTSTSFPPTAPKPRWPTSTKMLCHPPRLRDRVSGQSCYHVVATIDTWRVKVGSRLGFNI
ncbi:hypothetical protein FOQG_09031 [Fusarium oxysporum f. sp. raphani 54005]|uniref:Uncharacterized protein n=2 Tax=Fusarium oxysporum TaxID=5507 RepID=X0CA51_FUSOX|nr:hypothetical protein FOVG_12240 [Fusarium oxysporum f. sp. pisi HDV247]EXK87694.1 hypothetical protein FOQG_09031 [Fusarium oxysporum f. sp. raphani 54005]